MSGNNEGPIWASRCVIWFFFSNVEESKNVCKLLLGWALLCCAVLQIGIMRWEHFPIVAVFLPTAPRRLEVPRNCSVEALAGLIQDKTTAEQREQSDGLAVRVLHAAREALDARLVSSEEGLQRS